MKHVARRRDEAKIQKKLNIIYNMKNQEGDNPQDRLEDPIPQYRINHMHDNNTSNGLNRNVTSDASRTRHGKNPFGYRELLS